MNITKRIVVAGVIALSMAAAPTVRGQYTADYQTNIISGVTSNWSVSYYVGGDRSSDTLLVESNGVLTDANGYLSYNSNTSNNSVLVTDTGSIWSNSGTLLYIGVQGKNSSLVISNGGQVFDGYAYIGAEGSTPPKISSSNSVVVTGTGSVWNNGQDLNVGYPGWSNSVLVSNGALLINNNGYIGNYAWVSTNNSVIVTDAGSVWTNLGDTTVGVLGGGNCLTISNGANIFGGTGYVGYYGGTNSAVVTGSGSLWTNRNDLDIGYYGGWNRLLIRDGGVVKSATGHIGVNSSALNNSVVVSGNGSVWETIGSFGTVSFYVGDSSAGNSLIISNGGIVWSTTNGIHTNFRFYVGNSSTSFSNTIVVTGTGSAFGVAAANSPSYLGNSGPGNTMTITAGGKIYSDGCIMGYNAGDNCVVVADPTSVWSNRDLRYIGYSGGHNSLIISNGGQVVDNTAVDARGCFLGYNSSSVNNRAVVTGTGSVWNVRTNLYVGYSGGGNSLVISNGAQVIDSDAYVSYNFPGIGIGSSSNVVRVADGGVWQNHALFIGYNGWSDYVVVAGGSVLATSLNVGFNFRFRCANYLELDSGNVVVTNATHDAVLEVRNGSFIQNGGVLQADVLVMTNACGLFVRNGGTLIVGTLVLDPNLSAVGDGIPNGWKQQYGLDPFDPNLANEDADGDGMSNLQEYLAGTDPTNSASFFGVTAVAQEDNDVRVTWMTGIGRTNALQATTGNADGSYSNNFADIFSVTGATDTVTNYLDGGAATNSSSRYYRVRLVP